MEECSKDFSAASTEETGKSTGESSDAYERSGEENQGLKEELVECENTDYGDVLGLTADAILKKVFRTDNGAYEFYKRFGKCHGFAVRKGDCSRDAEGRFIRRRFFCNRAGLRESKHYNRVDRQRVHKPEIRTKCKALLSIYLDEESGFWKVRTVVLDHNHELTHVGMVHLMPNFREMTNAAKAQIKGMQDQGVATAKILGYMAGQAGGYSFLGFSKKDAYNFIDRSKRGRIADGDSNATIGYLEGKAALDPMCMAKYELSEDNMLGNLFWADGGSRIDYHYFGDVLAFDSTYKKNKYRRLLVIFSGCNNHKQTTIFRFGLVKDETVGSYTWLLETLLEVMCERNPSVVVTDGCESMRGAIRAIFPKTTHRLCAWHMEKNVTANVKEDGMRDMFRRWLY